MNLKYASHAINLVAKFANQIYHKLVYFVFKIISIIIKYVSYAQNLFKNVSNAFIMLLVLNAQLDIL